MIEKKPKGKRTEAALVEETDDVLTISSTMKLIPDCNELEILKEVRSDISLIIFRVRITIGMQNKSAFE